MNALPQSKLGFYAQAFTKRASRSYVAGTELANALLVCHRFAQQGLANTVGYWNSADDTPRYVADAYLEALAVLGNERLDSYLSIKAPALGLSPVLTAEVVEKGRACGVGVHFDALEPEAADATFALLEAAGACHTKIGCTLPGHWQRSLRDAELAVARGWRVRVVKGQWEDEQQADKNDRDLRAGFLNVIDRLAGRARHVAVATHDPMLAREALRRLRATKTPCELELLYGLPQRAAARSAREQGVPVRVYVPYGEAWLPYRLSQIRKNPRILWWVLRDALLAE